MELPDGLLDKATTKLIKLSSDWTDKVTRGAVWDFKGNRITSAHAACHSWLSSAFYMKTGASWGEITKKTAENFLCLTCHSKVRTGDAVSPEAMDSFVKWLARDSLFSDYVLNKDDHSLTEGGLVLLCGPDGLNGTEAMWVCKVLRLNSEGGSAIENWYQMVQRGVDPLFAVYFASFLRSKTKTGAIFTGDYGHVSVVTTADPSAYLFPKIVRDAAQTFSLLSSSVKGATFGKTGGFLLDQWNKTTVTDDGWGVQIKSNEISYDDLAKNVLSVAEQIKKAARPAPKPKLPSKDTVFLEIDM